MEKVRIYDKLVRDRIPEVIESNGDIPIIRTLGKEEYRRELMWKLQEEVNEVLNANSKEQLIEELADVLEVLKSIAKLENKSMADVIEVAQQKKLVKGGFEKRIYLEKPMVLGQEMVFDELRHNFIYKKIDKYRGKVKRVYEKKLKVEDEELKKALREFALEEVREKEFPKYPSRFSSLHVSRTLKEAEVWYDLYRSQGKKTYQIVKIETNGRVFTGDAWNVFDGTANKEENIELARNYWTNGKNSVGEEPVYETLVDGKIKVIEIVKENLRLKK